MRGLSNGKEVIIFVVIIALVGITALAAFHITGPMGIEERFQNALGFSAEHGEEPEGSGFLGFSLEGNPYLFAGALCGLGILCYGAYRYFRI